MFSGCFDFRIRRLFSYFTDFDGSVLPFVALTIPVLLGMVGLGADASYWMYEKRDLQAAADAGVLAAGWEIAQDSEVNMDFAAFKEAQNNGYEPNSNGVLTLEVVSEEFDSIVLGLTLTQDSQRFFSSVLFSDPVQVSAYAEAIVTGVDGRFCILALESLDDDSLSSFGSVVLNAPDCGLAVNSSGDEAMRFAGNSDITVGSIRITGDYDVGNNVDLTYESLRTGQSPLPDPYEDLEVPEYEACDHNNTRVNSSATLSPGVYCGGLDISGTNDIEFEPGVYIIEGDDFKVTGGGTLYGDGVTFIFTGSGNRYAGMDISGGRSIEFSAPQTGEDWSGITFFQDRNAPSRDNFQNRLTGTADIVMNGLAYFPSQGLYFGGDSTFSSADTPCTKIIARTVTLAGNPLMGNSCSDYDIEDLGTPNVRLVK